ncbi:WD40 repeat domain-containing protein [Planctomycetota bacterium]
MNAVTVSLLWLVWACPNGFGVPAPDAPVPVPPASITALAVCKGAPLALSGASDGALLLWKLERELRAQVAGQLEGAITGLAWAGAKRAFATDDAGNLGLVVPQQGVRVVGCHRGGALSLAASADGALLATAGGDGTIQLWSGVDGEPRGELTGHEGPVAAVAVDGNRLWSAGWDGTLRTWKLKKDGRGGRGRKRRVAGERELSALSLSGNGKRLLAACFDGALRLYETRGSKPPLTFPARPHGEWIRQVAFSPDGRYALAVAPAEQALVLLEPSRSPHATVIPQSRVPSVVAFHPDGKTLLVGRFDGSVERIPPPTLQQNGR